MGGGVLIYYMYTYNSKIQKRGSKKMNKKTLTIIIASVLAVALVATGVVFFLKMVYIYSGRRENQ